MAQHQKQVTTLLLEWRRGDQSAADQLIGLVYDDLRRLAAHHLRNERPGHTLAPTALVHELYLRLFSSEPVTWQNRAHFFAVAANTLRRLLVDHARSRQASKHGGKQVRLSMTSVDGWPTQEDQNIIDLEEALTRLEKQDKRTAQVVELRFFGGLDESEVAEVLGVSTKTVSRDWRFARAWLKSYLMPPDSGQRR